jgi:SAM-dependent methyltransferase
MTPREYSFPRYLAAKKTVDDRALNRQVLHVMGDSLQRLSNERPMKVLEIGAGIGTMIERMIEWDLISNVEYTAIDSELENIEHARQRLLDWAALNNMQIVEKGYELKFSSKTTDVIVKLLDIDLFDFLDLNQGQGKWDLLVAHAFLDLVDVPSTLPKIFNLVNNGGLFYFSINYDGLTVLQPDIDHEFDEVVLELYHRTMEQRMLHGHQFGDRHTGRHLFQNIQTCGGKIIASGSSDWIVYPGSSGYNHDEAYFLHFIIHTIYRALDNHAELDDHRFEDWIRLRHDQIDRQDLVYIAHQLDYFGICPSR